MQFNTDDDNLMTIARQVEHNLRLKALRHESMYLYGIKQERELDLVLPLRSESKKVATFLMGKGIRTAILKERVNTEFGFGWNLRQNVPMATKVAAFLVYVINGKVKFSTVEDDKIKYIDILNPKPEPALDENGVPIPRARRSTPRSPTLRMEDITRMVRMQAMPSSSDSVPIEQLIRQMANEAYEAGVGAPAPGGEPSEVIRDEENNERSWTFPSRTNPTTMNTVRLEGRGEAEVFQCSCIGFRTHQRCWHIEAVRARLANQANQDGGSH